MGHGTIEGRRCTTNFQIVFVVGFYSSDRLDDPARAAHPNGNSKMASKNQTRQERRGVAKKRIR